MSVRLARCANRHHDVVSSDDCGHGRGRGEAAGPAVMDLCWDMATACSSCEQQIAQGRDRTTEAASTFRDAIISTRSLAEYGVAHRGTCLGVSPDVPLPYLVCAHRQEFQAHGSNVSSVVIMYNSVIRCFVQR